MADLEPTARVSHSGVAIDEVTGIDLTICDREPIHLPGSVQPHGMLLIAGCASLKIVGAAGDLEKRLTADWLGNTLGSVLGQDIAHHIAQLAAGTALVAMLLPVRGVSESFNATMRLVDDLLIVELEALTASALAGSLMPATLDETSDLFDDAPDLKSLFKLAAAAFRKLTGFDRIMIY